MLKRIITALWAAALFVPILFLSGTWVFPIAMSMICIISLYEMLRCMGFHKKLAVTLPLYFIGAGLPIIGRLFLWNKNTFIIAFISIAAYIIYIFALIIWSHGKLEYGKLFAAFGTTLYIIISISMTVFVRDFANGGKYVFWLIFIGAWMTDIFAYFTGFFFGKHKLIEDVSPKKTIEGSIGGTVFCSASFVAAGIVFDKFFGCEANLIFLAVSGVIVAVTAQIGDLILSVIKRHYNIKDYGRMFPGHGGMLDRFDSVLAVSLIVAAVCMFSEITGIRLI